MAKNKSKIKFKVAAGDDLSGTPRPAPLKDTAERQPVWTIAGSAAAIILALVGFVTFFSGLSGKFLGDDSAQIINNRLVHSLMNLPAYFSGGTFYKGQSRLTGVYYRPIMTTVYALLYSVFGQNPLAFHAAQLLLHLSCAFLLFIIFRYFFTPAVSLVLSLIFLVDPLNSQAVFAIASIQEPLFLLFGLLAFWVVLRFGVEKMKYALLIGILLLLSLLSKETGVLFIAVLLGYGLIASWGKWSKLANLFTVSGIIFVVYLVARIHAVGLAQNPNLGPIDDLSLASRLINAPAIIMFYLIKLVFPFSLAHLYYWVHPTFNLRYFVLPLIVEGLLVIGLWRPAMRLRRATDKRLFVLFVFFAAWFAAGLAVSLQIVPLDETVSETWMYFPLVGVLGMLGVTYEAFKPRLSSKWLLVISALVISIFAARTAFRGPDWSNGLRLASRDVLVSKEDYNSYNQIAQSEFLDRDLKDALINAKRSVGIYQTGENVTNLGIIYLNQGDYSLASKLFTLAINKQHLAASYEDLALMSLYYGTRTLTGHSSWAQSRSFLTMASCGTTLRSGMTRITTMQTPK
jgi:hypothetical protein